MLGNGFGPDLGYVVSILVVLGALIGGLIALIIDIAGRNRPRPLYPALRPLGPYRRQPPYGQSPRRVKWWTPPDR